LLTVVIKSCQGEPGRTRVNPWSALLNNRFILFEPAFDKLRLTTKMFKKKNSLLTKKLLLLNVVIKSCQGEFVEPGIINVEPYAQFVYFGLTRLRQTQADTQNV
jgi:hypothetical protein